MTTHQMQTGTTFVDGSLGRTHQGWRRQVTADWRGHKIRATIDRDSYDFQSRIFTEVWSAADLEWKRVETLLGKEHSDLPSAYEKSDERIEAGSQDLVLKMIGYAQLVLA